VARAFAPLETAAALGVLDRLSDSAQDCDDPTTWVCETAASVLEEKEEEKIEPAKVPETGEEAPPNGDQQDEQSDDWAAAEPPTKIRRTDSDEPEAREGDDSEPEPDRPDVTEEHDYILHYKTILCRDYERGFCELGDECPQAHGTEELRNTEDNEQFLPCADYSQGLCELGDSCRFSHFTDGAEEQQAEDEEWQQGDEQRWDDEGRFSQESEASGESKRKTELCRHYARGYCQLGSSCNFAHGDEELRPRGEHEVRRAGDNVGRFSQPPTRPAPAGPVVVPPRIQLEPRRNDGSEPVLVPPKIIEVPAPPSASVALSDAGRERTRGPPGERPLLVAPAAQQGRSSSICWHFSRGVCHLGTDCRYRHVLGEANDTLEEDEYQENPRASGKDGYQENPRASGKDGYQENPRASGKDRYQENPRASGKDRYQENPRASGKAVTGRGGKVQVPPPPPAAGVVPPPPPSAGSVPSGAGLCRDWVRGRCNFGTECRFTHASPEEQGGYEESEPDLEQDDSMQLEERPPPWREGHSRNTQDAEHASPEEICVDFRRGACKFGNTCKYIHGTEDINLPIVRVPRSASSNHLRIASQDNRPHVEWGERGAPPAPPAPPKVMPIKYKMELCRHFERGHCQLGDLCGYAHGERELSAT